MTSSETEVPGTYHVGTSGWHYDHWKGPFYPASMSSEAFLGYYIERFQTVEVNNTFYQLPEESTLRGWRDSVPDDFLFAIKANRYITHMKKLSDPEAPVSTMLSRVSVMGNKAGPILFQLPPRWHSDPERLRAFLDVLPPAYDYTFEFRDPTWFEEPVYEALREHGAAFCIYHLAGRLSPRVVTANFVYVRLHGPEGAYQGRYSDETLAEWVERFEGWLSEGKDVYCYFDNDEEGHAPHDATRLREQLASQLGDAGRPSSIAWEGDETHGR